jgi:hypothetical protein
MTPISKYGVAHERRNMDTSNDIHSWHSEFEVDNKNNEVKKQLIQSACSLGFSNTDSYDIASNNSGKSTDISATFYQREPSHKTHPSAPFGKCFHRRLSTQNCARDCTVANVTAGVTSFTAICEINKEEHTAEQRTKADVSGSILPALKTLFRGCVHPKTLFRGCVHLLFSINNHFKLSVIFNPSTKWTYTSWAATIYPTAFMHRLPTVRPRSL